MEWDPQRPSAPSTPSSMSSQSTGNSAVRSEKFPALKQISPSPSVSALSKLSDDELRRKGHEDLVRILRRVETDYKSLLGEHGNIVKDVNRRFQIFLLETRSLKEVNQKLQDDNQELRDLCCFLDDDRQRGRKLAREWQRFGRYTASVMRSEVSVYQEKLRELEDRQSELVNENMELKELCLFLDQERVRMTSDRDEGDGSSNGTVTAHEDGIISVETNGPATPTPAAPAHHNYPITPSSAATYIRELELKVHRLEEEKRLLAQRVDRNSAEGLDVTPSVIDGNDSGGNIQGSGNTQSIHGSVQGALGMRKSPVSSKPEAVVHAMKVLQVHEELEKTPTEDEDLDDPEKAIVREMCNVVWRKLGDVGDVGSFNESLDSILDPPYVPESPGKVGTAVTGGVGPSLGQGQTHSYSVPQPQPQMASTPLSVSGKMGGANQFMPAGTDQFPGSMPSHQFHPQRQERHHPLRSPPESNTPPANHLSKPAGHPETMMRGRQNAVSERLVAEKDRNFTNQLPGEGLENKRKPEHSLHPSADAVVKSAYQPHPSTHPRTHASSHQPSQNIPGTQPGLPQQPTDLSSRNSNMMPSHYQGQLPAQPLSSVMPRNPNQRSGVQYQSGHLYSQHGESTANSPGSHANLQQPRNAPVYSQQPVKLLDAPGAYSYGGGDNAGFQPPRPASSQQIVERKKDVGRGESSSHAPARPHSRGEIVNEDRNSAERDSRSAGRSLSSTSAPNQQNTQITQNMPTTMSQQNLRGPAGFRAYPPQLTSMPTQPVSWRGQRNQDSSVSNQIYQPEPTPRPYPTDPHNRPGYGSGPSLTQTRTNTTGKYGKEQEWRQTYLDDSDTL